VDIGKEKINKENIHLKRNIRYSRQKYRKKQKIIKIAL